MNMTLYTTELNPFLKQESQVNVVFGLIWNYFQRFLSKSDKKGIFPPDKQLFEHILMK